MIEKKLGYFIGRKYPENLLKIIEIFYGRKPSENLHIQKVFQNTKGLGTSKDYFRQTPEMFSMKSRATEDSLQRADFQKIVPRQKRPSVFLSIEDFCLLKAL